MFENTCKERLYHFKELPLNVSDIEIIPVSLCDSTQGILDSDVD